MDSYRSGYVSPVSKVHEAHMWPHVGPMNLAIREVILIYGVRTLSPLWDHSLSRNTSYGQISRNLEAARSRFRAVRSFLVRPGVSAAVLPRHMSSCKTVSRLHVISYIKTPYRLMNKGFESCWQRTLDMYFVYIFTHHKLLMFQSLFYGFLDMCLIIGLEINRRQAIKEIYHHEKADISRFCTPTCLYCI